MENLSYRYWPLCAALCLSMLSLAARVKVNCERLKWMAGNALRPPAQK